MALNIDFAPTFAAWAGSGTPEFVDGRSLVPLLEEPTVPWRRSFLIQRLGLETDERLKPATAITIRTERYPYLAHNTGEHEMYHLERDPHQLENIEFTADDRLVETLANRVIEPRPEVPRARGAADRIGSSGLAKRSPAGPGPRRRVICCPIEWSEFPLHFRCT